MAKKVLSHLRVGLEVGPHLRISIMNTQAFQHLLSHFPLFVQRQLRTAGHELTAPAPITALITVLPATVPWHLAVGAAVCGRYSCKACHTGAALTKTAMVKQCKAQCWGDSARALIEVLKAEVRSDATAS
ncbi:hypothetical protein D3C84_463480 [compost metagenome]